MTRPLYNSSSTLSRRDPIPTRGCGKAGGLGAFEMQDINRKNSGTHPTLLISFFLMKYIYVCMYGHHIYII